MDIVKLLQSGEKRLAVVGLGYVGLPLAVSFAKYFSVIGLDQNAAKIASYQIGHDMTEEVGDEALGRASITYTSDMYMRTRRRTSGRLFQQATVWAAICRKAALSSTSQRSIPV